MTIPAISSHEFSARRRRATDVARQRGLDGLLICSRGGGTVDRYGDVMYLTNFYTPFPFVPDFRGNWSARAHTFLLLPVGGKPHLVIDVPGNGNIQLADGTIENTDFVLDGVKAAISAAGLEASRIGLVGSDVFAFSMHAQISSAFPRLVIENADDVVSALRKIKSPHEIAALRNASRVGSRMIEIMLDAALPGASHGDIIAEGLGYLVREGGILYNSFMSSGPGGDPSRIASCYFPTWGSHARLQKGDWLGLGISGAVGGYVFDLARSKAVGPASARQVEFFEAAVDCVQTALTAIHPGVKASDLADAGLDRQLALGLELEADFSAMGHGIGLGWDAPWLARGVSTPIEPGMVLCVERGVSANGYFGDFEQTVLITDDGYELLTDAPVRSW